MKKILILVMLIVSTLSLTSCNEEVEDVFVVVENLKLTDTVKCKECNIKFLDSNHSPSASYYITPNGFEMDKLEERGYYMEIEVTYNVYYKKDYDVLWDIGYAGSPKYEISILNSDGMGQMESNLTTKTSKVSRSLMIRGSIADIKNQRWVLTFSTDNVQNVIYFTDIVVNYRCYKY